MQDLKGSDFTKFGTVTTFSWLAPGQRGRGIGTEMRAAVLHLAFAGLGAREAESDAFTDNHASNRVSWDRVRRDDIELVGVRECLPALGLL